MKKNPKIKYVNVPFELTEYRMLEQHAKSEGRCKGQHVRKLIMHVINPHTTEGGAK